VAYFCTAGYLIYIIVERSMALFIAAVVFFLETLLFAKYFIDILLLRREKAKWYAHRVWVPLGDLVVVCMATFTASLLLPCGVVADLWHQLGALDSQQFWLTLSTLGLLLVKLCTAVALTVLHVRRLRALLPATLRVLDPYNYPYNTHIVQPSAPNDEML
jgi:hypothetical protein